MKNLLSLFAMALIVLLSVGCNKDDDDGGSGNGTGGSSGDLFLTLSWEDDNDPTTEIDFDLSVIQVTTGAPGCGNTVCIGLMADLSGDVQNDPGEEFIRFMDSAPDGQYVASVVLFSSLQEYPFELIIESSGDSRTFNDIVSNDVNNEDDGEFLVNFTKNGRNLTF